MTPDVVVIGAGHNGLVAGGYLARAGLSVVVLEAAPKIGGMTVSEAVIPAAPDHLLNLCAVDVIMLRASTVVEDLELARYGYREVDLDPMFGYLHPDGESVVIWRDVERTVSEFSRLSPSDGRAYRQLCRVMSAGLSAAVPLMTSHPTRPGFRPLYESAAAGLRGARSMPSFVRMVAGAGSRAIDVRFTHPVIRSMLMGMSTFTCDVDRRGTGLYLFLLGLAHRYGVGRPVGGMGALSRALGEHLRANGGTVRTGARVESLILSGGRAEGVRLADGSEVRARIGVLATGDPATTLLDLVDPREIPGWMATCLRRAPRNATGAAPFKIDLALSGQVHPERFLRHDGVDLRIPSTFIGTEQEITAAYRRAVSGVIPEVWPLYAVIPTSVDPTQAPSGQDTMYLYSGATPSHPATPWSQLRSTATDALMKRAGEFYSGIDELELGRHVESHEDLFARTGSHSITQLDLTLLCQGPLRPAPGLGGYRTPIDRLWICGAGTHPGGTVAGISGKLAAATILRGQR